MTRTSPPPPTPDPAGRDRCVAPADLTAFVLGEGDDATRSAIARHVFGCAACRARRSAELDVVGRLEAFADLGAWEEDLAAADLARSGTTRARRRGAFAGAAAAAVLAAAVLAAAVVGLPFGTRGPAVDGVAPGLEARARVAAAAPSAASVTSTPTSPTAALLEAQASDGRWQATTGLARHDVGATGLALIALLDGRPGALAPESLVHGPVARAVAAGVRWLAPRADDPQQAGDRERAVAAAALARVFDATRDRAVGAAAERARRTLAPGTPGPVLPAAADVLVYVRAGPREVASTP